MNFTLGTRVPTYFVHFDMECRPLSWYGGDWVTKEPTALAFAFSNRPDQVTTWLLRHSDTDDGFLEQLSIMYGMFLDVVSDTNVNVCVSGHWVRGFDLPLLNGTAFRIGAPSLPDLLVSDTKSDLVTLGGLSKSQENLGSLLALQHKKESMNTGLWESANRLTTDGIEETRRRVEGDVRQHIEMRAALLPYLSAPRVWQSSSSGGKYVG